MYIDHLTSVMLASLLGTSQKVVVTFVVCYVCASGKLACFLFNICSLRII